MDDSGIRRRVDDLGRVVIPADYRRRLGIEVGDQITFSLEGDRLIVELESERCVLCDSTDGLTLFRERPVCQACMTALAVLAPARPDGEDAAERLLVLQGLEEDEPAAKPAEPSTDRPQAVSTTAW